MHYCILQVNILAIKTKSFLNHPLPFQIFNMKKKKDKLEFAEGEENVYSEDVREDLIESDAISPEEEGFMAGYDKADEEKDDKDEEDKEGDDKEGDDEESGD